jgi:hypothetical protein
VVRAIEDLKARGLKVTFYPFVMMDIPADNTLPDPYTGEAGSRLIPGAARSPAILHPASRRRWTGRVPRRRRWRSLFGTAAPAHFSTSGTTVNYSGPAEWTLRRMILHYAKLCAAAGGVETFLIGSEMEALTRVRSAIRRLSGGRAI